MELRLHKKQNDCQRNFQQKGYSLIQLLELDEGKQDTSIIKENRILFVVKGSLSFSLQGYGDHKISKGQALLIPAHFKLEYKASETITSLIIINFQQVKFSDCFSLIEHIQGSLTKSPAKLSLLEVKPPIWNYLEQLNYYIIGNSPCCQLVDIKIKELFLILGTFYTQDELRDFFYPLVNKDSYFFNEVIKHYVKVKNAQELAKIMNYSYSGFMKRFKVVFGVPAYTWIKQRKAEAIYNEIKNSNKSFKEIAFEFGFSSPAKFSGYCQSEFSISASKIRNENKNAKKR